MAPLDTNPPSASELSALVEKKATFQRGVRALAAAVATSGSKREYLNSLFPVVQRVFTLLKTRHSNADFFRTGQQLFDVCARFSFSPEQLSKVKVWRDETGVFLAEHPDEREPQSAASTSFQAAAAAAAISDMDVMELLLNPGAAVAALGGMRESHLTDAGIITDDMRLEQLRASAPASTPTGTAAADGSGGSMSTDQQTQQGSSEAGAANIAPDTGADTSTSIGTGVGSGADAGTATGSTQGAPGTSRAQMQRQILEGIQAIYSGMEAVTRGTEAVERELGSVLEAIQARAEAGGKRKPPPASKALLSRSREVVSEVWLAAHPETSCAVCFEALELGDDAVVLPCAGTHAFHAPCVAPWFSKTNSCPVCRYELPSEDPHYDAAKEREKEEDEERRGAANAVSHNEFMYI